MPKVARARYSLVNAPKPSPLVKTPRLTVWYQEAGKPSPIHFAAPFQRCRRVHQAGEIDRRNDREDRRRENGGHLAGAEGRDEQAEASRRDLVERHGQGEGQQAALGIDAEDRNGEQRHQQEGDAADADIGQLLADEILADPGRRGVEIGDGAEFLLAHHTQRRQHRRDKHEEQHHDAGHHRDHALEILVVAKPRHQFVGRGIGELADGLARTLHRLFEGDALHIATRRLAAEGKTAIDEDADLRPATLQQVTAEIRRHLDRHLHVTCAQALVEIVEIRDRRRLGKIGRPTEAFHQGPAFQRTVAVEHGIAQILDIEGHAEAETDHEEERRQQGKGEADGIAPQLQRLAPGKDQDAAQRVRRRVQGFGRRRRRRWCRFPHRHTFIRLDQLDEGCFQIARAILCAERRRCAHRQRAAAMHEGNAVAARRFVHEMRGDENRDTFVTREVADLMPEGIARLRIDAGSWLVEDEDPRLVQAGGRQLQALALPEGEIARQAIGDRREIEALQGIGDARRQFRARHLIEPRMEIKIGADRQFLIEREALRHVADIEPRLPVLRRHRLPQQARRAAAGRQQAGQHLHRRRLAAAVRAEEAEDLARLDAETDPVHGDEIAEPAGQLLGLDGRWPVMLRAWRQRALMGDSRRRRQAGTVAQGDECLLQGRGTRILQHLWGRSRGQQPAAIDGDEMRKARGLLHIGGGGDEGEARPLGADLVNEMPELPARQGIDAGCRLIEDEEIGIVNEGAAEAEFLLHAAGELAGRPVRERVEAGGIKQPRAPRLRRRPVQAEEAGEEIDVLLDGQRWIEVLAQPLRHIGDAFGDGMAMTPLAHIAAQHIDVAILDATRARDERQQRRLADTVRPDDRRRAAGRNLEADILQGEMPVVAVLDAPQPHGRLGQVPGHGLVPPWAASAGVVAAAPLDGGGRFGVRKSGQVAAASTLR
jgi:hypothetical protein